ncbi:MAG: Mov34/MPN/PAD-1 family protein [Alphaproteobacteria bacterium]|nr:Mov34/MPN/PAD-1 family protein [Alphaproteobacteria bacterium]
MVVLTALDQDAVMVNPFQTGGLILFEGEVLAGIARYRQQSATAPEQGGVLLGYRRDPHLHVVTATFPARGDRATRFFFKRDDPSHAATALRMWKRTKRMMDYLGEWHTHPESHPSPSSIDTRAWATIRAASLEVMLFMIAGTGEDCWMGCGNRKVLLPVRPYLAVVQ